MYIKVFELSTWDCEILYGHTDIVLSIDVYTSGNHFVSSGKVIYLIFIAAEVRGGVGRGGINMVQFYTVAKILIPCGIVMSLVSSVHSNLGQAF